MGVGAGSGVGVGVTKKWAYGRDNLTLKLKGSKGYFKVPKRVYNGVNILKIRCVFKHVHSVGVGGGRFKII